MLKQMRRRVIVAAMLAFFAVIVLIAALVNIVNYAVVAGRSDRTLDAILTYEDRVQPPPGGSNPPPAPFMALPDLESNYMTRFFVVRFDSFDNVVSSSTDYIASVNEEEAVSWARQILECGSDRGFYGEYRYAKAEKNGETVVVFLNIMQEQEYMRSLLILTIIVSLISLVIVFILVALLSGKAIKPIADNIGRQKQFITDASHELKTPLTSISTSIDVIEMESGESEWTDNIRNQTGRMSNLVSELVALSRLDEELPLPSREQFSLSNAAWEIAEVYQPSAKAAKKNMEVDIADDVTLFGDKAAIQQMMSVLLDNAVRYSDENGDIRFSVFKKRGKAVIEVFNTCHFDEIPDVKMLFERFYRPDDSRSTETGGTGLGLAIAKAVTEAHNGTITASCPTGQTMTIKVVL